MSFEDQAYKIWVGGLPNDTNEDEVAGFFEKAGKVVRVRLRFGTRDTFAFVEFESKSAARYAIEDYDQKGFHGKTVKVSNAFSSDKGDKGGDKGKGKGKRDDRDDYDDRKGKGGGKGKLYEDDFDDRRSKGKGRGKDDRYDDDYRGKGKDDRYDDDYRG